MKKHKKQFLKIFSLIFGFALILTGCATVSDVKNPSQEILNYGNNAVTVGDYTYFANAYTPFSDSANFDYKGNAKLSYLARIDNKNLTADGKDFSPSKVEKVNDKVTGFQNQDMFVLGNYIYFTSMNTHKNNKLENNYSLITLWRSKLNGDGLKEIFTTDYFSSDSGMFAPVGDAENGYYWVCYTGAYAEGTEFSGDVFSVKLGNNLGKVEKVAEKALTAVFSNVKQDGQLDKILYTTTETVDDRTTNHIYGVDYSGKNKVEYAGDNNTINLVAKVRDDVFFTEGSNAYTSIKAVENLQENDFFTSGAKRFVSNSSIKNINIICEGAHEEAYLYVGGESKSIMYLKKGETVPQKLLEASEYSDLLFVDDEFVYFSDATSISRISNLPSSSTGKVEAEKIVTMTDLQSGQYGYDGQYIYFYAKLEDVELEGESEDEENTSTDDNYYMYRVAKGGGEYQLISKTQETRKPKKTEE